MIETLDKTLLNEIILKLVKVYNPVVIYLFGSYAWGIPEKNSDIDFFIIIEKSSLNHADRIRIGLNALSDYNIAIDLIVLTMDEINSRKDHPSTLTHKVISKGKKIYEAA